jgi:hypothetical protein
LDNDDLNCSPCAATLGRQRWFAMNQHPSFVISAEDLAIVGVYELIRSNNTTPTAMISHLLNSGILPRRIRRYEHLVAQLIEMPHLSHSDAARNLRVTRWTVAAWRQRLGITTSASTQ